MGKYDCINCINDDICDLEDRKDHAYNLRDGTKDCFVARVEKTDSLSKALAELRDDYNKCSELFDIAYSLNFSENTRTAFSQKVTTYMPEVMQTLGYFIGKIEEWDWSK